MTHQTTEEILIEFGVHLGFGEERKALARDLEKGSLTGGDLQMVCDHVKDQSTSKTQGARISSVLKDKNRWGPLLADLRKFHEYRHHKDARIGKKKQEPGKWLRDQDQGKMGTGKFFGLTDEEYLIFKWKWTVADWMHRGHDSEALEKFMDATQADVDACLEMFPKGKTFDEALAEYAGMKGKKDASNTRPD